MADLKLTQDPAFADRLEAALLRELRTISAQGENTRFSLRLSDAHDRDVGGLLASTSYGWLLIKVLYVAPEARGLGHGRALLTAAFEKARTLACHSVWLDTSDAQASGFYASQGFEVFGHLINGPSKAPIGHNRWFMRRSLG